MMRDEHALSTRVATGLIGFVLLVSMSVVFVRYGLGEFDGGYQVTVVFDHSAQSLDNSSDVKVRGVTVGTVGSIKLRPDGHAEIELRMRQGTHVATTSIATIEPLSVFGPKFVNIEPGANEVTGPYLAPGGEITQTTDGVDFTHVLARADELLHTIEPSDLVTIFRTFAASVDGLGPAMGRILDNGSTLVDIADRHVPDTQQLITDLATLSGSLVGQLPAISTTLTNAATLAPTFTDHTAELGRLLDGTSQVAGSLSANIDAHSQTFGTFIDSAASVLKVAYDRVPQFPEVFRLIDEFFGRIGDALRLEAPGGQLIGALHGGLLDNICSNLSISAQCSLLSP